MLLSITKDERALESTTDHFRDKQPGKLWQLATLGEWGSFRKILFKRMALKVPKSKVSACLSLIAVFPYKYWCFGGYYQCIIWSPLEESWRVISLFCDLLQRRLRQLQFSNLNLQHLSLEYLSHRVFSGVLDWASVNQYLKHMMLGHSHNQPPLPCWGKIYPLPPKKPHEIRSNVKLAIYPRLGWCRQSKPLRNHFWSLFWGLFIWARSTRLAGFPRSRLATLFFVKISMCSYERLGWPGYQDLGFCDRDLVNQPGDRDETFSKWLNFGLVCISTSGVCEIALLIKLQGSTKSWQLHIV